MWLRCKARNVADVDLAQDGPGVVGGLHAQPHLRAAAPRCTEPLAAEGQYLRRVPHGGGVDVSLPGRPSRSWAPGEVAGTRPMALRARDLECRLKKCTLEHHDSRVARLAAAPRGARRNHRTAGSAISRERERRQRSRGSHLHRECVSIQRPALPSGTVGGYSFPDSERRAGSGIIRHSAPIGESCTTPGDSRGRTARSANSGCR